MKNGIAFIVSFIVVSLFVLWIARNMNLEAENNTVCFWEGKEVECRDPDADVVKKYPFYVNDEYYEVDVVERSAPLDTISTDL